MASIVWWEIETPDPETFQGFHNTLWGWTFRPAFADSALGADYWIITLDATGSADSNVRQRVSGHILALGSTSR
jgi:predicted enzyme related to lactoylglutathione lyase